LSRRNSFCFIKKLPSRMLCRNGIATVSSPPWAG
jgi:hypothetical protein